METEQNGKSNNQAGNVQNYPFQYDCADYVYQHKVLQYQKLKNPAVFRAKPSPRDSPYVDEPIDLTCSEKREDGGSSSEEAVDTCRWGQLASGRFLQAAECKLQVKKDLLSSQEDILNGKRGRKRRSARNADAGEFLPPRYEEELQPAANPEMSQITDNRQVEVLKAAKSLFSKRTRTLYHWLYPHAPKAQLKAAVASSWETLGEQEKEFYVSQVLGRFGFPQTNLMINPQLGGLANIFALPSLDLVPMAAEGSQEVSTAVSSLLLSENDARGYPHGGRPPHLQRINRRRAVRPGRARRPIKEEYPLLKDVKDDVGADEFQDDPELSREFQQFRWTLHFTDSKA